MEPENQARAKCTRLGGKPGPSRPSSSQWKCTNYRWYGLPVDVEFSGKDEWSRVDIEYFVGDDHPYAAFDAISGLLARDFGPPSGSDDPRYLVWRGRDWGEDQLRIVLSEDGTISVFWHRPP